MMKNIKIILTVLALLLGTVTFAAFSEPACDPTGPGGPGACNTAEPVNISSTAQAKTGLLGLGGLLLNLVGNLSFGTPAPAGQFLTTDSTGRAIWSVPAGGGGSGDTLWGGSTAAGIYNLGFGLVGTGTQTPNSKLTVTGGDINITSPGKALIATVAGDTNWASIVPRHQTTGNIVLTPATAGGQQRDVVINAGKLCLGTDCRAAWPAGGTAPAATPDRFGGMYSQTIANLTCPAPNPYTGDCSCPSGYATRSIVAVGGGYSPIFDLPYMTYYCYYIGPHL